MTKRRVGVCAECGRQAGVTKAGKIVRHRAYFTVKNVACAGSGKPEKGDD